MGSFIGHAVPGSFFFLFGLWWATQALRRHFLCRQTRQPFRSTLTFPIPYCSEGRLRNVPVEPIVKIVFGVLGTIVEIIGGTNHVSHRFDSIGNTQHITMYLFFALSGFLDLMTMKGIAPHATDYLGLMIALLVEGALFKFHLFGRSELDVLLHTLLLYTIAFTVVVVALEAAYRTTPVLPLLRGLLTMLQGTWFWGVGFILYPPTPGAKPWDPEDHHTLMLAVLCFTWHLAANLIIVLAVGAATACCYGSKVRYSQLNTLVMTSVGNEEGGSLKGERGENGGVRVYRDEEGERGFSDSTRPLILEEDDLSDLDLADPVIK